jgi:hypothetical protein
LTPRLSARANYPASCRLRTAVLRPAGAAPAKWGGAAGASKGPHEIAWVAVADPPANLLHCQVSFDQETTRLCHAALGEPLQNRPPRLTPDDRGEVAPRQAHRPRHALCHVDACFGLPERRIVRGSFEAHVDDLSLAPDPRHVLWAEGPIG